MVHELTEENIYFYYTNDLHSHFAHWPSVAYFMKKKKEERTRYKESYRLIDIGDHMDRFHPITEGTLGQANISLLNDLNYDYVTLGNNEGITFSERELYHLYDEAEFEVICSNLNYLNGQNPNWLKAVSTETLDSGVKIGYIGLTATFNPYYNLLGWHADDIYETLEKQVAQESHPHKTQQILPSLV